MGGKRRPSGDGLIRKRSDGRWEGRIVVGHKNDGTPMYKSVFGKTQKELMPRLSRLKEYYAGMDMTEESRMTLGEWLTKWIDEYKAPMIRESTATRYRHMINNHIIPNLGSKIITQVATQDIQKMYNKLKRSGRMEKHKEHGHELSNSMVRAIHMMLHEAMDGAVREGLIPVNPTEGTTIPKLGRQEKTVLLQSQIETFLKHLEGDEIWYDFFYTDLMTGMRRGEICGLKWTDFDAEHGKLHVQRTIRYQHGQPVIGETKTSEGNRVILLPRSVYHLLCERKKKALTEWIFPKPTYPELPLDPGTAYAQLKRLLKEAGLPDIRFHDLRHTFATQALRYGMDVKTLACTIGHESVETTLNVYSHATDEGMRTAAKTIDKTIGSLAGAYTEFEGGENEDEQVSTEAPKPTPRTKFEPYKGKYRRQGTGSIHQVSKNVWEGRYSPIVNGKRITRNIYAGSIEECEEKLAQMITKMKEEYGIA